MSKKRTATEYKDDDETNKELELHGKRDRPNSVIGKTLQDLPNELVQRILVESVAMEVKILKLSKRVWKEKAPLVISRLSTVSTHWSNILATNSFQKQLHRALDGSAEISLRLESLYESPHFRSTVTASTSLNDEIFLLCRVSGTLDYEILVYDRNSVVDVMDVIPSPPDSDFVCISACSLSNCVYAGVGNYITGCFSVVHVSKTSDKQFYVAPWINSNHDVDPATCSISASSSNGSLMTLTRLRTRCQTVLGIYNADGSLHHEIMLPNGVGMYSTKRVIQKANGNFVLACVSDFSSPMGVVEIDSSGSVVRHYKSPSLSQSSSVNPADIYGRIMITETNGTIELLDSEMNPLGEFRLEQDKRKSPSIRVTHYDRQRNEIMRIHSRLFTSVLSVFRLKEE